LSSYLISLLYTINQIINSAILNNYINQLNGEEATIKEETEIKEEPIEAEEDANDFFKAATYKTEASELKSAGDYEGALEKFNLAIAAAPPSALLLANRADVLLRLGQYDGAVKDCVAALEQNPDRYEEYFVW